MEKGESLKRLMVEDEEQMPEIEAMEETREVRSGSIPFQTFSQSMGDG